jgi:hypothetical protein
MLPSSPPSAHSTRDAPLVTPNAAQEGARPSTIQNRNAAAAIDNAANTRAICANSASQPGPEQSVETPRAALPLPNDIANVVTALLDGRTDAADIIAVVSDRLSIARHEHDPGLVLPSPAPELQADGADRADLASAFARWHQQAAQTVQLRRLAAQFRLRRLSSPGQPKVTRVSTWAERDAALRDDAVSIASSGSTASVHTSSVIQPELPFTAPEDMPVGLQSHRLKWGNVVERAIAASELSRKPFCDAAPW